MNAHKKGILGEQIALQLLRGSTSFGKYINDKNARFDVLWLSKKVEVKSSFTYPFWRWAVSALHEKADFYLLLGFNNKKVERAFLIPGKRVVFKGRGGYDRNFQFGQEKKYKNTGFPLEKYEISLK